MMREVTDFKKAIAAARARLEARKKIPTVSNHLCYTGIHGPLTRVNNEVSYCKWCKTLGYFDHLGNFEVMK